MESTLSTEVKPVARDPVNIFEYEELARENLPKSQYDFIAGGATDEITLRRTRDAYDALVLRPRMLVDVSNLDIRTTVQGQEIPFPIMMDPAGDHGRAHPEAERATARAAGSLGTVMVVSSAATFTM